MIGRVLKQKEKKAKKERISSKIYLKILSEIIENKQLTPSQKIIFSIIMNHCELYGQHKLSQEYLASAAGCDPKTVKRATDKFEELNLVELVLNYCPKTKRPKTFRCSKSFREEIAKYAITRNKVKYKALNKKRTPDKMSTKDKLVFNKLNTKKNKQKHARQIPQIPPPTSDELIKIYYIQDLWNDFIRQAAPRTHRLAPIRRRNTSNTLAWCVQIVRNQGLDWFKQLLQALKYKDFYLGLVSSWKISIEWIAKNPDRCGEKIINNVSTDIIARVQKNEWRERQRKEQLRKFAKEAPLKIKAPAHMYAKKKVRTKSSSKSLGSILAKGFEGYV